MRGLTSALLAVFIVILALSATPARGADARCTTVWGVGSTSGSWTDPNRWSAGVPDAADVACVESGTLSVPPDGALAGELLLTGGLIDGPGVLAVARAQVSGTATKELRAGSTLRVDETLRLDGARLRLRSGSALAAGLVELVNGARLDGEGAWTGGLGPRLHRTAGTPYATYALAAVPDEVVVDAGELRMPALSGGVLPYALTVAAGALVRLNGDAAIAQVDRALSLTGTARVLTGSGADALRTLTTVNGSIALDGATLHTNADLSFVGNPRSDALLLANGGRLESDGAIGLLDALVRGVGAGNGLQADDGVTLGFGSSLGGSLTVAPSLLVQAVIDLTATAPEDGLRVEGSVDLQPSAVLRVHADLPALVPFRVTGTAALGGTVQAVSTAPDAAPGTELTLMEWASFSRDFETVDPASLPFGSPVFLGLDLDRAFLLVDAPPAPAILRAGVLPPAAGADTDHDVTVFVELDPGLSPATLTFQLGLDAAYDLVRQDVQIEPGVAVRVPAELRNLVPGTTYHARWLLSGPGGTVASDDIVFTTTGASPGPPGTPPAPQPPAVVVPPPVVVTPQAVRPKVAYGPRTFALSSAGRRTYRVTTTYRLTGTCASPCRAVVELLLRTGKQTFAAGDGRVLARTTVTLRRGTTTLRLSLSKAAARRLSWHRAGRRFETVAARLRVTLPQADGTTHVTVRDGVLRRLRTR